MNDSVVSTEVVPAANLTGEQIGDVPAVAVVAPVAEPPPMLAAPYPAAAPHAQQHPPDANQPAAPVRLATGSAALKQDVVAAGTATFGDASNVTGIRRDQTGGDLAARRRLPVTWLAGGGAVAAIVVVVVIVLAMRGGHRGETAARAGEHDRATTVAAVDPTDGTSMSGSTREPAAPPDPGAPNTAGAAKLATGRKPVAGPRDPLPAADPASPASEVGTDTPSTTASDPPAPTPLPSPPPVVAKRPAQTLGGKKVVLEYDSGAKEPAKKPTAAVTPAVTDETAVRSARATYFNGNKKLFAGDADGAIKLYQQALVVYPGYVASYRGLGLAYAQKGDTASALKAFRTYMRAVPAAKDIPLIKQRVSALQKK